LTWHLKEEAKCPTTQIKGAEEAEMTSNTERLPVWQVSEKGKSNTVDVVVKEFPLTITLNNREVVTLLCSPTNLDYLAIGFLFSEGLITGKDDIKKIIVDQQTGVVRVESEEDKGFADELLFKRFITSGCGRGASFYSAADVQNLVKVESDIEISASQVFALVDEFVQRSEVFKATGGVHSAALCDTENILVFSEDIGRHNAIDKVFGECMLKDIPTAGRLIITSGRVSSEILLKVARRNIPLLISKSAPTNLGVRLADDLGVTLVGFARGRKMNVYANEWRIVAKSGG
jgi:FdhD protein